MSYAAVAKQATRYKEAELMSATPGQLVVAIYDHILVNLTRARLRCGDVDGSARSDSLDRARAGITELLVTLDRDKGGPLARQLGSLYTFWLGELSILGIKPDPDRIDAILRMVNDLRAAFAEAANATSPTPTRAVS